MTTITLATLDRFIGQELGVSSWTCLDQHRIDKFAKCTGDEQWIHVDVARAARESPFGGTIAHGYLTLSLVPMLAAQIYRVEGLRMGVNYGATKVRFPAPVPAGRNVRTRVKLVAVEAKGSGRTLVTTENTVEIEGHDKPALIATALSMVLS